MGIVLLGIVLGLWRGTIFRDRMQVYQSMNKQLVTIHAIAITDAVYEDKGQLSFDVGSIKLLEPYQKNLEGKIGIKGYG
ncbi:MAG: ComEC/Rec2 family competence protein, partial [Patescibacteria group bacterium]|nr:ComEC/Rec2 family competence protein [Patescibacteria group bacterium]